MKKVFLGIIFIASMLIAFASEASAWGDDWYVSAANYGRYYYFKQTKADSAATRFQYDIYMGEFYTGGWYEVKHLKNTVGFNSTQNELTRRYFGWENKGLTIHVGNFYEVYDRGLVLNTFRDDDVSVDKALDGVKLNWRTKYVDFDALSAVQNSDANFRPIVRGLRTKFKPLNMFHLGGAYVSYIDIDNKRQNITQVNQRFLLDYIDTYVEYARRNYTVTDFTNPDIVEKKVGDAIYFNSTGYYSYFSALFEYKNYHDMFYPSSGYLNIPPAVNRQDRLLSTEAGNVFNPILGERGFRTNLAFSLDDYWGAEIEYSQAKSRNPNTVENDEFTTEIRGRFLGDNTFRATIDLFNFSWQDSFVTSWTDTSSTNAFGKFKRNELKPELDFEFVIDHLRSIEVNAYLINYSYTTPNLPNVPDTLPGYKHNMADSSDYTEKYLSITFSQLPKLRVTVGGSLSDQDPSNDPEKMAFVEATYIWDNHELTVFHGSQRGGLVCSGGVCSYHPTFEGLRVTLLSRL